MYRNVALAVIACLASLVTLQTSGCGGGDEFPVVPISGTLTCNGNPVSDVALRFIPAVPEGSATVAGRAAGGVTDASGNFTLTTYESGDGAILGRHQIMIFAAEPDPEESDDETPEEEEEEEEEPQGYEENSLPCPAPEELFVEITAETSVIDIEMADGGSVTAQ